MRPIISSLNQLLEEVGRALENEKRFTSNAAHELKTTLATIQAEV
jgi:two-component system sensor histidine kinase QseC